MIISQKSALKREANTERYLVYGLVGLLALLLGWVFLSTPDSLPKTSDQSIRCDAERVRNNVFVQDGHTFEGGQFQSNERARSGSFSCALPADGEMHYGFSFNLPTFEAGTIYKASVWRFQPDGSAGRLVAQGFGEKGFYQQVETPSQIVEGWELLEVRFSIPYGLAFERINVHVYGGGSKPVFFDDLKIEEVARWSSEEFTPEVLDLRMDNRAYEKLQRKRDKALEKGILESSGKDWVEAELQTNDSLPIPVKVRLKGDWLDHLEGKKWSFRVKVKSPYAWKRMRTFSLHTPKARYFLHEWLLHQIWEQEDVLTTRYDFVELRLNGQSLGVYAYEEHFEKQLAEYRQRREGPILKFSEDGFWAGMQRQLQYHGFFRPETEHTSMLSENADILPFDDNTVVADSAMARQFEQAQNLMYQFKYGLKPASEIFDIDRLAKYYAICDLLNAYHGIVWHNQRFYYNPITNKLEPIGFDGFGDRPEEQFTILGTGALDPRKLFDQTIFSHLFLDPAFAEKYIHYLYDFSTPDRFADRLDSLSGGIGPRQAFLTMEFPDYQLDLSTLAVQANFVRSLLLPFNDYSLNAYALPDNRLILRNRHNLPLQVVGFGNTQQAPTTLLDSARYLPAQIPRKFWMRTQKLGQIWNYNATRFLQEQAVAEQGIPRYDTLRADPSTNFIFYKVLGIDEIFQAPVNPWQAPDNWTAGQLLDLDQLAIPDQVATIQGKSIRFKKGSYTIRSPIKIPAGYQVFMPADLTLDFIEGALFFCQSPLEMIGLAEAPIFIRSSDGTARGFTVFQTAGDSRVQHVVFDSLNTLNYKGWSLTGGVTFYEADVQFYRTRFLNSRSEDALNVIRSTFELKQSRIQNSLFDGLDSDFCKGRIEGTQFVNIGNDAADFSGSVVNIRDIQIDGCGDKGISVGEESDVHVLDSQISNAPIGVASKDLSLAFLRNIRLENCDQGFIAFQKKPEFGGGKVVVESYTAKQVKRLHTIAPGSSLQLELQLIQ